ncbi:MutS-related protein [Myroides odoratus]|uniref:MutS-related protein n=1 Tax=Myroides odoratus TaxID=256 RepID=UPI0039AEA925
MEIYAKRHSFFQHKYNEIRKKYKIVGALRLVAFLGIVYCFYLSVSRADYHYLYVTGGLIVVFLIFLRIHASYSWKMRYAEALMQINQEENDFIKEDKWPSDQGTEFHTPDHPYAFDLDIFGPKSIYQYLNRTASYKGKEYLATLLKSRSNKEDILKNQEVIKELSQKVEWRQEIYAYSKLSNLSKESYERLKAWSQSKVTSLSKVSLVLAYALPLIFAGASIGLLVDSSNILWGYVASTAFTFNLICALAKVRTIQIELGGVEKIHETIESYSAISKRIEKEEFATERMKDYLKEIKSDSFKASVELKKLSRLFEQLETVANLFVSILFNGLFQFHVHVLHKFLTWKKEKGHLVEKVIDIVGEIEAFNSLGNFSYNNRSYTFPVLNDSQKMTFQNLGHPLLHATKRVTNDIDFSEHRFVILTGSNMSGKSTFLRTMGVNLVLAGIGAPICATKATFFPLPLLVSMRLTDSLDDSESYFYAEVKRLKMIIEHVQQESCFVLLDEILRGTNSDDKQSGTIGVILKLIREKTYGMIATHDLEVCNTTHAYPSILSNKCFEVEINQDDLHFDYKIRDGICQNKNATFIMKKMQIID